jgi:hypothetical protein
MVAGCGTWPSPAMGRLHWDLSPRVLVPAAALPGVAAALAVDRMAAALGVGALSMAACEGAPPAGGADRWGCLSWGSSYACCLLHAAEGCCEVSTFRCICHWEVRALWVGAVCCADPVYHMSDLCCVTPARLRSQCWRLPLCILAEDFNVI